MHHELRVLEGTGEVSCIQSLRRVFWTGCPMFTLNTGPGSAVPSNWLGRPMITPARWEVANSVRDIWCRNNLCSSGGQSWGCGGALYVDV